MLGAFALRRRSGVAIIRRRKDGVACPYPYPIARIDQSLASKLVIAMKLS